MVLEAVQAKQDTEELSQVDSVANDRSGQRIISSSIDNVGAREELSAVGLASLPQDVLIQVAIFLDPWDVVRCRHVSEAWNRAFADSYLLEQVLRYNLKSSLEVRGRLEHGKAFDEGSVKVLFNRLASRYYHLAHGKLCSVLPLKLMTAKWIGIEGKGLGFPNFYPIGAWDFHRSRERVVLPGITRATFDQAFWTYDDELLVYPAEDQQSLVLLDLENEISETVPFELGDKIVRNFRLKCGILIIEWAESKPFHALNIEVPVHRHFVALFRISCINESPPSRRHWSITPHAEFRLHFLGLPLMDQDRFFSTHTSTHYAVYFWQPNRSMYTGNEEEPIESLLIWDISSSSTYLPSLDPSGLALPHDSPGPKSIARLSFRDLDFYNVRQRSVPALMHLSLDSAAGNLRVRENQKFYTPGYFDPAERCWRTCTTIIPFLGYGPHQHIADDGSNMPPYVGNCSMESDEDLWDEQSWCENWVNIVCQESGVMFSLAQTMFRHQDALNWTMVRVMALGREAGMDEKTARLVTEKGKLAGDERWLIGEADGFVNVLRFDR